VNRAPCFQWEVVPGAGSYTFQIAPEPNEAAVIERRTATISGQVGQHCLPVEDPLKGPATPALAYRKFFWRLRTDEGAWTDWCEIRTQPLAMPSAACEPGNPVLSRTPTFTWLEVPWRSGIASSSRWTRRAISWRTESGSAGNVAHAAA